MIWIQIISSRNTTVHFLIPPASDGNGDLQLKRLSDIKIVKLTKAFVLPARELILRSVSRFCSMEAVGTSDC